MTIENILKDEAVAEALLKSESEEEFRAILTDNGAEAEEIDSFIEDLRNLPEELTEEELAAVAGGGKPYAQIFMSKWAYRMETGKIFCKATYDEDNSTITVTNRFGTKNSIDYIY